MIGLHRDARRLHVDQQERDAFLLLGVGIGAHEGKDHVGPVRHRRPDLLPVDHIVVAVANRARLEAGEVRAGAGLRVALAPPGLVLDDAGEILLLLLGCAEGVDHRPCHGRAERDQRRCARAAELLLEGKELLGLPAEPAMLLRPFSGQPPARAQPLQPGVVLVTLEMLATRLLAAHLGRHLAGAELPHLLAEGIELGVVLDGTNEHGARLRRRCYRRAPAAGALLGQRYLSRAFENGQNQVPLPGRPRERYGLKRVIRTKRHSRRLAPPVRELHRPDDD